MIRGDVGSGWLSQIPKFLSISAPRFLNNINLSGEFFLTLTDCPDCGCQPGELHELFCLKERCPFCGAQLAGCGCIKRVLQLSVDEQDLVDTYEDDSQEPLRGIIRKWERTLQRKGRIPYLR